MNQGNQMDEEFMRGGTSPDQDDEYFGYDREMRRRPTLVSQFYQNQRRSQVVEAPTEANVKAETIDSVSESLSRQSKESNAEVESSNYERNMQAEQSSRQPLEQDEIEFAYEDIDG